MRGWMAQRWRRRGGGGVTHGSALALFLGVLLLTRGVLRCALLFCFVHVQCSSNLHRTVHSQDEISFVSDVAAHNSVLTISRLTAG